MGKIPEDIFLPYSNRNRTVRSEHKCLQRIEQTFQRMAQSVAEIFVPCLQKMTGAGGTFQVLLYATCRGCVMKVENGTAQVALQ